LAQAIYWLLDYFKAKPYFDAYPFSNLDRAYQCVPKNAHADPLFPAALFNFAEPLTTKRPPRWGLAAFCRTTNFGGSNKFNLLE
jgi:hypothetical protein